MNDIEKVQYAAVEYPFPLTDIPVVHCPVCGCPTYKVEDDGSCEMTPCPHLSFIFVGEPSTFEYKAQDFTQRSAGKNMDHLSFENMEAFLLTLNYDNHFLALEVTYGGMGMSRIWRTDIYGFDYSAY